MKYLFTMLLLFMSQAALTQTGLLQSYCYLDEDRDGYGDPNTGVLTSSFGCDLMFGPYVSNNFDCNDRIAAINPNTIWYKDFDDDGYSDGTTIIQCSRPSSYKYVTELTATSGDCNDNDPYELTSQVWYSDPDNDGYIVEVVAKLIQCQKPLGNYVSKTQLEENGILVFINGTYQLALVDCNETDPLEHPNQKWYKDEDGDKYTSNLIPVLQCTRPVGGVAEPELASLLLLDCDDANPGITIEKVWYKDADNDGFTDAATITQCTRPNNYKLSSEILPGMDCNDENPAINPGTLWYKDADRDQHGTGPAQVSCTRPTDHYLQSELSAIDDCNDGDGTIHPDAPERCDGLDNDCDLVTDEDVQTLYAEDKDEDGVGNNAVTKYACSKPERYVLFNFGSSDCDDDDPDIGSPKLYSLDADKDGYGQVTGDLILLCAATAPTGYSANNTDCNDNDENMHPGAAEICDGIDNDCDGLTDEGFTDTDNDDRANCIDPDDDNDGVPDATDNCPLIANTNQANTDGDAVGNACDPDDDNDGIADGSDCAALDATAWRFATLYRDADADGFTAGNGEVKCYGAALPAGWLAVKSSQNDCDDNDPAVNPAVVEVCGNKKDDKCNGLVDEVACYPCRNATAFSTTNITANSATVNWISIPNPEQWQLQYKSTAPGGEWIDVILTGNKRSYTLTGLASRQTYNWHVRAKCGKNWTSYNDAVVFITTGGSANRYGVVTADEVTRTNVVAKKIEPVKNNIAVIDLQASVMPNPTTTNFKLVLRGHDNKEIIKISVADMYGRIIEERILTGQQTITFGDKYKAGVYMVSVIHGKQSRQLKLVKL